MRKAIVVAGLLGPVVGYAQALGSAFTYQGQLDVAGQPASGLYDLQACLFESQNAAAAIACAPDAEDVPVAAGLFTVTLDFGTAPFVGQPRWLELRVRPGATTGAYATLAPRQPLRATPEALRANVASAAPWSGLSGVPAGFADGVDADSGGTVTSIVAGTGLTGGTITGAGTIAIANGGVGPAQIAPGAVGALQLAPGIVGAAQIDPSQVQARIAGTCAVGEYFRGVAADGSIACEPVPGLPSITTVYDPSNDVGRWNAIAIGDDGLPIVSFIDFTARDLLVAKCSDSACRRPAAIATIDTDGWAATDIAVGPSGLPVIAYLNANTDALRIAFCSNPSCTSATTRQLVPDATGQVSLVLPPDGLPAVAYRAVSNGRLRLAKCGVADCSTDTGVAEPDPGSTATPSALDMVLGSDGLPFIAYRTEAAASIRTIKCGTPGCGSPTVATPVSTGSVGFFLSAAIGNDGRPIFAFDTNGGIVRFAKCLVAACNTGADTNDVDSASETIGEYVSLAVGADGLPIVSHYAGGRLALRVARCGDDRCVTPLKTATLIEDSGSVFVGTYSAIAIGRDGLPVIAYRDISSSSLKVAKCGSRSCL